MLTTRETQLTGRKVGAKETLALLLFGGSLRVARHAVVVRTIVFCALLSVTFAHLNIVRAVRCVRSIRTSTFQRRILLLHALRAMC